MLKLIIADDERIIRETISSIIDWESYNIQLIGLCQNGLEAYDLILDESPDIVLTDIRMPGIDGLELIQRISETDLHVHFIILSGYSEFEYAKKAMKYGVKHYLLKPCNETQIIESVQDLAKDCFHDKIIRNTRKNQWNAVDSMYHHVMFSIINDAIYQNKPYDETMKAYELYMDFYYTPYHLFYIYFLEQDCLEELICQLDDYCLEKFPFVTVHGIYTSHTLLLFFQDFATDYQELINFLISRKLSGQSTSLEWEQVSFSSLSNLLFVVLDKIKRYSMIYYINHKHILSNFNYNFVMAESENLYQAIGSGHPEKLHTLIELLDGIHDLRFLKQLASSLFLKITAGDSSLSTTALADTLLFINQKTDLKSLKAAIEEQLNYLLQAKRQKNSISSMTQQIFDYVEAHIKDPNLTLKNISEQYLYMNTDYVSKKFQKDTGIRFSAYLTNIRIEKAKEYLSTNDSDKIQTVAEMVGCGNNPQYFSQLFKKNTGMSPGAYAARNTSTK